VIAASCLVACHLITKFNNYAKFKTKCKLGKRPITLGQVPTKRREGHPKPAYKEWGTAFKRKAICPVPNPFKYIFRFSAGLYCYKNTTFRKKPNNIKKQRTRAIVSDNFSFVESSILSLSIFMMFYY